jgi:hypothetical protein
LLVRSFFLYGKEDNDQEKDRKNSKKGKKISKDTGEYVDYEELEK